MFYIQCNGKAEGRSRVEWCAQALAVEVARGRGRPAYFWSEYTATRVALPDGVIVDPDRVPARYRFQ